MMKFLLIVLLITLIGEVINNRIKNKAAEDEDQLLMKTRHPAEYDLR